MEQYRVMKGSMRVFILGFGGILEFIFGLGGYLNINRFIPKHFTYVVIGFGLT